MAVMSGDLETRFRWVTAALIALFSVALGGGLALHMWEPGGPLSVAVLEAGLVLLMASPAVRLLIALAERLRRRDWLFVLMTMIIVVELAVVMWRAAQRI